MYLVQMIIEVVLVFFLCLFKGNNKVMYTGRYETS